jgi:dihydrolipoamide dehydrogenase
MRKVTVLRGYGSFVGANHVQVEETTGTAQDKTGSKQVVSFKNCIISAGGQAVHLPLFPDDPRVVDSTGALQLAKVPKRMLVVGGGIIGLEMATVYSTLGARIDVVEMTDGLMQGADRDLVKVWQKMNAPRFDNLMLKTKTVSARAMAKGIEVTFEGEGAPAPQLYDLVLQAVGRTPNGKKIAAEKAGVAVTDRGYINVDDFYQTSIPGVYAAGDITGPPWLAHTASFEAIQLVEGLYIPGFKPRKVGNFPGCTYCHPQVASVGKTERDLKAAGIEYTVGKIPFAAIGKAIAAGEPDGFAKLLYGKEHGELLGAHIIGDNATELIAEMGLALDQELTIDDIHATIHAHPTMSEVIHEATLAAEGHAIHF